MIIPRQDLSSGYEQPRLGLGTWDIRGREGVAALLKAFELGYNHVDTAEIYENQREIGQALQEVDRGSIFVTSKVPAEKLHREDLLASCQDTLRDLQTDYLDMLLIHWPNPNIPMEETFAALKEAHERGWVRSIGVSNFISQRLERALAISELPIANNQVEFHPLLYQRELLEFCTAHHVGVVAYSPLARGKVLHNGVITGLAAKHHKSPAQITLRWLVQKGCIVIPKAGSETHLRENMDIFDWELPPEDEAAIDDIEEEYRLCVDPTWAEF